jgi:hypothetical protein
MCVATTVVKEHKCYYYYSSGGSVGTSLAEMLCRGLTNTEIAMLGLIVVVFFAKSFGLLLGVSI